MKNVHISHGNMKIGKIFNINLPPGISCYKGVPCNCNSGCYALKAYKMYPNVKKAWDENFEIYQDNPKYYFDNIIIQLKSKKYFDRFRWHSSGDIVD